MTPSERVLVAASKSRPVGTVLNVTRLVTAAWSRWPEVFGLEGARRLYPASHVVMHTLAGSHGLIARGFVARVEGGYIVTAKGARVASLIDTIERVTKEDAE